MFNACRSGDRASHDATVVQQHNHMLILLCTKLFDDWSLQPHRRCPIHSPEFVTGSIVAQLIKLGSAAVRPRCTGS